MIFLRELLRANSYKNMLKSIFILILILSVQIAKSQNYDFWAACEAWRNKLLETKQIFRHDQLEEAEEAYYKRENPYPTALPSQTKACFDDINFDGKIDVLFYFFPDDIMEGRGILSVSDFSLLIVSSEKGYLVYENNTEVMKAKIAKYFGIEKSNIRVSFSGFKDHTLRGEYLRLDAGEENFGSFEYDVQRDKITVKK